MRSEIRTFTHPNGEIQRVQTVTLEDWRNLDFWELSYAQEALDCFYDVYRLYLVPSAPWLFGNLVMFHIPEDVEVPFSMDTKRYGKVADRLTAATAALEAGVTIAKGQPKFRNDATKAFWQTLAEKNCIRMVSGKLPTTKFIPVGDLPGYMSRAEQNAPMKVNASFFIMDRFDCATVYDHVGTPFGMRVKNGVVFAPPLFGREALLVRENGVSVERPDVRELGLEIGGFVYRHGQNAAVYTRPDRATAPRTKGKKLVIIGDRVSAVCGKGTVPIPASGFVLAVEGLCRVKPGDQVIYRGMEDVIFGIQVGNSILKNGVKTEQFLSRFYNLRRLEPVPFPPSLYPMDFEKARAARIALGADRNGNPMVLWAEGAGKLSYTPGQDSCGASLTEMAELCEAVGMVNAVNLDGGGSAQILLNNQRSLHISDRKKEDNSDAERPIPLGLILR